LGYSLYVGILDASFIYWAFPRSAIPFHVSADASNYQLGAMILQEGKPLALYSRKLNSAQKYYTTGEQEFLSI
jgi:hypothetical protein